MGMERLTIRSTVPKLDEIPGLSSATTNALVKANLQSTFRIAKLSTPEIARATSLDQDDAAHISTVIRLTLLRGIGVVHANRLLQNGIGSVCELSGRDPLVLWNRFQAYGQVRPTPAEVRVWIRAAQRNCIP